MEENFEQNKAHNAELLVEAQFALQNRSEPNITLMSVSDYGLRNKLVERLKEKLPEYRFYEIDLTPHSVVSLRQSLQTLLPAEVLDSSPITYCVNVFGLENSRLASEDGQIADSGMIAQLNYEREIIFRKPNYLTILWGDRDFFVQLQRQAPDFWSWVTYFFEFKQEEKYKEVIFEKEFIPEFSAILPEREEHIRNLEAKLEHMPLNDLDKSRTTQERLNLYSLLAEEYANYFDYDNSKKYYLNALRLCEQLGLEGYEIIKLLFDYATINLKFRYDDDALILYSRVLKMADSQSDIVNIGAIYHQIGMTYEAKKQWSQALENYDKSLHWKKKTGQEHQIDSTYHHIGLVYQKQQDWANALESYGQSLDWCKRTGQENNVGSVYQIGRVYEEQHQFAEALKSYRQVLHWCKKTGQIHQVGRTYEQIGLVYHKQLEWEKALESYDQSLDWKERTGQEHQVGRTYNLIGNVYEMQNSLEASLKAFETAFDTTPKYQKEERDSINKSIQQVKCKLEKQVPS